MENKTTVNTDIGVEIQNIVDLDGVEKVLAAASNSQTAALEAIAQVQAAETILDQRNFENIRDLALLSAVAFLIVKGLSA